MRYQRKHTMHKIGVEISSSNMIQLKPVHIYEKIVWQIYHYAHFQIHSTVVLWYTNIALFSTLRHLNQYLLWHFLPKQTSEILVKSIHYHLEQCFARSTVYIIWGHFQLRLAWKSAESTPKLCQLKIVLKWYGLKKKLFSEFSKVRSYSKQSIARFSSWKFI